MTPNTLVTSRFKVGACVPIQNVNSFTNVTVELGNAVTTTRVYYVIQFLGGFSLCVGKIDLCADGKPNNADHVT